MATKRDIIQETLILMVGDWESSCRLDFISDLLCELDDEALMKVAEKQGVEFSTALAAHQLTS